MMQEYGFEDDDLLDVFGDERSRAILAATASEPKTVSELSDVCGMPKSTVYRRVKEMLDKNQLIEGVRLRSDGQHAKEYHPSPGLQDTEVELSDALKISVSFDPAEAFVEHGEPSERAEYASPNS